jgi:hypothetical protein
MFDKTVEFNCAQCGRHIIRMVTTSANDNETCAECTHVPDWFKDPKLRAILDPAWPTEESEWRVFNSMSKEERNE